MDKLAAIVALVALGGVAWMAFGQEQGSSSDVTEQMEQIRAEQASISERLDRLLAARQPDLMAAPAAGWHRWTKTVRSFTAAENKAADGPARAASVEERMAKLEETFRKEMADLKKGGTFRAHRWRISPMGGKRFLRSADDAATTLNMSDAQKSDMERILEDAKHELDRLYDTPNEDGETLAALKKKMAEEIKSRKGDEPFTNIFSHISNQQKFKQGKVPGTDETYAQAERRISKAAMDNIRRGLNPDQQKEWDNSHTGALLPGSGGTRTTVSTVMVGGESPMGACSSAVETSSGTGSDTAYSFSNNPSAETSLASFDTSGAAPTATPICSGVAPRCFAAFM